MLDIQVAITGQEHVGRIIGAVTAAMRDFRPIWHAFRPALHEIAILQFATEGAHGGHKWKALSPEYARRKAITHPGRTILVRDGDLAESLISDHGAGAIFRPGTEMLEWGTSDPKAAWHQFGYEGLDRREVVVLTQQDTRDLATLAADLVMAAARRAGA